MSTGDHLRNIAHLCLDHLEIYSSNVIKLSKFWDTEM